MSDEPEWFAPKRYGFGSGSPISWQGWAVLGVYIVLLALAGFLLRYSIVAYVSVVVMLTAVLTLICARTTRGGWRWRWGRREDD